MVAFLSGKTRTYKNLLIESSALSINCNFIQGPAVRPTSYIIMESDLKYDSQVNTILKFPDDTNLLVPQHDDIQMNEEFDALKLWASENRMTVNIGKATEILLRWPKPRLYINNTYSVYRASDRTKVSRNLFWQ